MNRAERRVRTAAALARPSEMHFRTLMDLGVASLTGQHDALRRFLRRFKVAAIATLIATCGGCIAQTPTSIYVTGKTIETNRVCIVMRQTSYSNELVRVIQTALRDEGILSALYSPGTEPAECKTVLDYSVSIALTGDDPTAIANQYWESVDLDVFQNHKFVANGHFDAHGWRSHALATRMVSAMVKSLVRPVKDGSV
ncbi:hypothetical protein [Paraburkholderia sp. J94]|uniref:hypothetical protein n=2 Tax=unclassified Paraburkholderia TaxID=2615204 RepID=UPI002AB1E60E|nr:hypothetical protein [Paraburkholderia sp. J94]